MTPKQVLDSFSQTLLQDERILSPQERALLSAIVQHANAGSGANQNVREAVRAVIASSVGEVVAQRAFAVLGGSIVERILEQGGHFDRSREHAAGDGVSRAQGPAASDWPQAGASAAKSGDRASDSG